MAPGLNPYKAAPEEVGVPRGVADDIRLGLYDAAAGDASGNLPHQYLADEVTHRR
jgi:hypothetical protein